MGWVYSATSTQSSVCESTLDLLVINSTGEDQSNSSGNLLSKDFSQIT